MAEEVKSVSSHYDKFTMVVKLTDEDIEAGEVAISLDPYRVCWLYKVPGGPLEHIAKKSLRGVEKGHSPLDVLREIKRCADRGIEMILEQESRIRRGSDD